MLYTAAKAAHNQLGYYPESYKEMGFQPEFPISDVEYITEGQTFMATAELNGVELTTTSSWMVRVKRILRKKLKEFHQRSANNPDFYQR